MKNFRSKKEWSLSEGFLPRIGIPKSAIGIYIEPIMQDESFSLRKYIAPLFIHSG